MTHLRLGKVRTKPYRHLLAEGLLDDSDCGELLGLLEAIEWKESQQDFYAIELVATATAFDSATDLLNCTGIASTLRAQFNEALGINTPGAVRYAFQRYAPGAGIGPHTDSHVRALRFVLNLNRQWSPQDGGIWLLSNCANLSSDTVFVAPLNNSGFAFIPGENTFHALSDRNCGQAYAVVFEFDLQ